MADQESRALPMDVFLTGGLLKGAITVLDATNCSYDFRGQAKVARPCLCLRLKDESEREFVDQYWTWGFFTGVWPSEDGIEVAVDSNGDCGKGPFLVPMKDNVKGFYDDNDAPFMLQHLFLQVPDGQAIKEALAAGDVRVLIGMTADEGIQMAKGYKTSEGVEKTTQVVVFMNPKLANSGGGAASKKEGKKEEPKKSGGGGPSKGVVTSASDKDTKARDALVKGILAAIAAGGENGVTLDDLPSKVFEALIGVAPIPVKAAAKRLAHDKDLVAELADEGGYHCAEGVVFAV